ncbi:MAG TPA: adenylate/guanylate cyclase domain-containing protein [Pseudomonadales bacterium]|nr:adenylate/guanylate cyclase domain-containing protein [Pseudomonadales bacterium]
MSDGLKRAVMFTAVTGIDEVALRDGPDQSVEVLQRVIARLRTLAEAQTGEIVDSVGRELLIIFTDPDGALACAQQMQLDVHLDESISNSLVSLAVGLHHGTVNRIGEDIYGDAVNTAARVKSQATSRRVLVSQQLHDELNPFLAQCLNLFDKIEVKGKAQPLVLYEVPWESGDMNRTNAMPAVRAGDESVIEHLSTDALRLRVEGIEHHLHPADFPVSLGRGQHCDLPVKTESASRLHCRIEYRRGKFVLMDSSTNGTHLVRSDGSVMLLRREAAVLTGRGHFSLGEVADESAPASITFECI